MQIIKYFFVGGASAIVDLVLFVIFAKAIGYNYLIVACVTFFIATGFNYIASVKYVFKSAVKHTKNKEIFLVYVVSIIGLSINLIVLYIMVDIMMISMIVGKILASGSVFFWNYSSRKYYIF